MKTVSINANDVRKMFKVCGACLDTNGARECLQYIKIEVRGNKATAIGCDGFRLATVTSDIINQDGAEFDFFVKPVKIDKKGCVQLVLTEKYASPCAEKRNGCRAWAQHRKHK